jgi:hypothetical protein
MSVTPQFPSASWGREGQHRLSDVAAYTPLSCAMLTLFAKLRCLPHKGGEEEAA